jgi:hypothetical protein
MAPQKCKWQRTPLTVPLWRACRTKTMPPNAPKLCKLLDLSRNQRYLKFECRASFLAPKSSPQKRAQKCNLQKKKLKVPLWRACRTKTMPPNAPKLGKL